MVAQQILVLFVLVRIRAGQQLAQITVYYLGSYFFVKTTLAHPQTYVFKHYIALT